MNRFDADGWALVRNVIGSTELQALCHAFQDIHKSAGTRGILEVPAVAALAGSPAVRDLIKPILGPGAHAVRGIFFDKSPESNWKVPWHQDVTIAVAERHDVEGYGPWSVKNGTPHVQPPTEVLKNMLAVRVHLDDCSEENGALKVIPGSHQRGKLGSSEIDQLKACPFVVCVAGAGDVILMRPLLLHASSPARVPTRRRVIHLEFASTDLKPPLNWAERL